MVDRLHDSNGHDARPTNTLAILALVLSFVVSVGGIVCGHVALSQIKRTGEGGRGLALAGLIIGYSFTGLYVLALVGAAIFFSWVAKGPVAEPPLVPVPAPSGAPVEVGTDVACNPGVILIEPITDTNRYAAGVLPQISMRITNTGSSACTLDVGTSQQYYAIVSGSDPIWNSRDCQIESESFDFVLEPNDPVTTEPITWDRTRSSTTTCGSARPEVAAGGFTYRLDVMLGDLTSAGDTAFILD